MSKSIDFTKPLSDEDVQYVADRPWLIQDAELQGITIEFESDEDVDDEDSDDDGPDLSPKDWSEVGYPDLKAAATARDLDATGKADVLRARLVAYDAEHATPAE